MQMFHPDNRSLSPKHEQVYAAYEVWYTVVDFSAAAMFVVGSVFFFWKSTETLATWLFLIGSIFFALKPTIRLAREIHYLTLGKYESGARRKEA